MTQIKTKLNINTKEVNDKIATIQNMIKEQKFLASIYREDEIDKANPDDLKIEDGYKGPLLAADEPITAEWAKNALDYMRDQKKIHKKVVWIILKRIIALLDKEPTLKEVSIPE